MIQLLADTAPSADGMLLVIGGWVAAFVGVVSIATVVFQAGRLRAQLEAQGEKLNDHIEEDKGKHERFEVAMTDTNRGIQQLQLTIQNHESRISAGEREQARAERERERQHRT